jgi:glycosyltransferase involved in cell wall biosynthesis
MPRPLRVLFVHDRYSALGGADWHLIGLLSHMPERIQSAGLFGRDDRSVADHPPLPGGGPHFIKKLDKKAPFSAEAEVGRRLAEFLDRHRPDAVHVHNIVNPHLLSVIADYGPVVMNVQDHRFFCPGRGKVRADGTICRRVYGPDCRACFDRQDYYHRLMELVDARLDALKRLPRIVVLSRYMAAELEAVGVAPERISVVPPFVHGLAPPEDARPTRSVLFGGRMVWAKGIFDLLELAAGLPEGVRLTVAGSGTMDDRVAERARELGVADRVDFLGWVPHHRLGRVLAGAAVVVLPSRWQEPFGIIGLEAAAAGRPVAAFDVGGVREWLIPGQTGLIAPPGDVDALGRAVRELLDQPERADRMGRTARHSVADRFDPGRLMDRTTALYAF